MPSPLIPPRFQWITTAGAPAVGYKLNSYIAGSSTPQATYPTYTDAKNLTNPNANPVVLDSLGSAAVWLPDSFAYKFILTDASNNTIWTSDNQNQGGVYTTSGGGGAVAITSEWVSESATPTFISSTQFSFAGVDKTGTYLVGRRVKTTNTGGTVYSTVTASAFAGNTTVTVSNDGTGVLDSGLSAVSYGLLAPNFPSSPFGSVITLVSGLVQQNLTSNTSYNLGKTATPWPAGTVTGDIYGEWNATNGNFVPLRGGFYLITALASLGKNGATLTINGSINISGGSSGLSQPAYFSDFNTSGLATASAAYLGFVSGGTPITVTLLSPTFTGGPVQSDTLAISITLLRHDRT